MAGIVVIGGASTDIFGIAASSYVPGDSNPGSVRFSAGGVARNIAENLARLGEEVELITALGDDQVASMLVGHCQRAGIGLGRSLTFPGAAGSIYLAVLDEHGSLTAAVSDTSVLDRLTPGAIGDALSGICPPHALVLDANLTAEALCAAARRFPGVPLFVDCVSAAKAPRIRSSFDRITGLHANALEAEALTGIEVAGVADGAARAAEALHGEGVANVFITDGPQGVYHSSDAGRGWIEPPPVEVVNVTGAGDAFMAGVVWGTLKHETGSGAARIGLAAAALTAGTLSTVSPDITVHAVRALAEEVAR